MAFFMYSKITVLSVRCPSTVPLIFVYQLIPLAVAVVAVPEAAAAARANYDNYN